MELKSLKKKFKDKNLPPAARADILKGTELCGLTIEELMQQTLDAMRATEDTVNAQMEQIWADKETQEKAARSGGFICQALSSAAALVVGVAVTRAHVLALMAAAHAAERQVEQDVQHNKHREHDQNDPEDRGLEEVPSLSEI